MTPNDYDNLSAAWSRDAAERAQDEAMDAALRCDECGALLSRGIVWPHDYGHCGICGEDYENMFDNDDGLEDADWENETP